MISRIHESLSDTIDYIEMAGGLFASEKSAGVGVGSPLVDFSFSETRKNPGLAQETRRRDYARDF